MNEQVLFNRPLFPGQLNMVHPLTKGLVGAWLLNENGGMRAWDSSPYGNHGLLSGFAQPPKRGFNGLQFDGTDDWVSIANRSSLQFGSSDFTVLFWIHLQDKAGLYSGDCIGMWDGVASADSWGFAFTSATNLRLYYGAVGTSNMTIGNRSNAWQQLAMRIDHANDALLPYQNGQSLASVAFTDQTFNSTVDLTIGKFARAQWDFTRCSIAQVLIYNRALSAGEVKSLYQEPYQMFRRSR